jgi:hypothetical protein
MDDKDFNIDFNKIDTLLSKLASEKFQVELDLDYDYSSLGQAATITQAASSNTWPYVTNNTGGYTWTTNGTGNISPSLTFNNNWNDIGNKAGLHVKGDAEFEGDVTIKGRNLTDMLDKIEERLAILHPNEKLEDKWEELKKLGDAYRALEKDIIEKEKIWETLKK